MDEMVEAVKEQCETSMNDKTLRGNLLLTLSQIKKELGKKGTMERIETSKYYYTEK